MKMNTSSANLQAAKATVCSNSNPQAAMCSKTHPLPVSKKFYARIRERVLSVLGALGIAPGLTDDYCADVMRLVDRHLAGGMAAVSPGACRYGESLVIFLTLREEIDRAVERSRRAREAAARRRGDAQPTQASDVHDSATPQLASASVPSSPKPAKATPAIPKPQVPKSSFRKLPWKKVERPQPRKLGRNRRMHR